jgi:hypothetical protein
MKNILLTALISLSISTQASTTVFSFNQKNPELKTPNFLVSSFNPDLDHCYVGESESVCAAVIAGEKRQMEEYSDGAHDYFQVTACEQDHDQITVKAKLFDDYSANGESITAIFGMCN